MSKKLYIFLFILLVFSKVNAQFNNQFIKVDKTVHEQTFREISIKKSNTKLKNNCFQYKCKNNFEIKFCNNKSEYNYVEYHELGKLKNTDIIIINKLTYNEEFYILINTENCKIVTLYGLPLRIGNSNNYLVYNNPSTDCPYSIKILQIKDENIKELDEIIIPNYISPKKVICVDKLEIYLLDNKNQIWKTKIKS